MQMQFRGPKLLSPGRDRRVRASQDCQTRSPGFLAAACAGGGGDSEGPIWSFPDSEFRTLRGHRPTPSSPVLWAEHSITAHVLLPAALRWTVWTETRRPRRRSARGLSTPAPAAAPSQQVLIPWAPRRVFFTHTCRVCVPSTAVSHRNGFTPPNLSVLILKMGIITDPPHRTVPRRH